MALVLDQILEYLLEKWYLLNISAEPYSNKVHLHKEMEALSKSNLKRVWSTAVFKARP